MLMRPFLISLTIALSTVFVLNEAMSARGADTRVFDLAQKQTRDQLLVSRKGFDARSWVKARVGEAKECPDVLVAGSSTVGHFTAEMFPGKTFLNVWMGGPT